MAVKYEAKSHLSWLTWDAQMQHQMLGILKKLEDPGTVDDLGVRQIQIAFGNHFFPGTSVLLTRLRYAIFVIWILQDLEQEIVKNKSTSIDWKNVLYEHERSIWTKLKAKKNAEKNAQEDKWHGLIGVTLKDLPQYMSICTYYKTLLKEWGVIVGDWNDVIQELKSFADNQQGSNSNDDASLAKIWQGNHLKWPNFKDIASVKSSDWTFQMTDLECDYLKNQLNHTYPNSLLYLLMDLQKDEWNRFTQKVDNQHINLFALEVETTPWLQKLGSEEFQTHFYFAQFFANLMQGAQIYYHYLLCEHISSDSKEKDEIKKYREKCTDVFSKWLKLFHSRFVHKDALKPQKLKGKALLNGFEDFVHTQFNLSSAENGRNSDLDFITEWANAIFSYGDNIDEFLNDEKVRKLIQEREQSKKKHLSRFKNRKRFQKWVFSVKDSEPKFAIFDYRWSTVRKLMNDFHNAVPFQNGQSEGSDASKG